MIELWKYVKGYGKFYQVSNFGSVRSLRFNKIKVMSFSSRKGYASLVLVKDKKQTTVSVLRLVVIAFIDNPLDKPVVNHKDSNIDNNCAYNLEWMTQKENMQHALKVGRRQKKKVPLPK